MELKKSYAGFVLWIIGYLFAMFFGAIIPVEDTAIVIRLTMNICTISIAILTLIIYLTGYVYWYNGVTYEEAVEAGNDRRKHYALQHLKSFGGLALVFLLFSVVAQLLNINYGVDIVIATIGLIVAAISTIKYKL